VALELEGGEVTIASDREILERLKPPPDIAKTIGHVIPMQEFEYGGSAIDKAMLWLLRKAGER
jgi:hypothetical protein